MAVLVVIAVGLGFYVYSTNPFVKAVVDNDESKLFYYPTRDMKGLEGLNYEEIALKVEESVTIYNYMFQPSGDTVKATVFFLHGSGGNVGAYAKHISALTNAGYRVYAVDWRGFGKSTGAPMHINVLEDTKISFQRMLDNVDHHETPLIVYGQSLGGQVAVKLTQEYEDKIDALVLDGSVLSFPSIAADFSPVQFLKDRARNHPEDFHQPYKAEEDIKEVLNTPKLIIQSKDDKIVIPLRGKTLFENSLEPKEFWETDGEHINTLIDYPEETIARIDLLIRGLM